jgi:hypothetical protein
MPRCSVGSQRCSWPSSRRVQWGRRIRNRRLPRCDTVWTEQPYGNAEIYYRDTTRRTGPNTAAILTFTAPTSRGTSARTRSGSWTRTSPIPTRGRWSPPAFRPTRGPCPIFIAYSRATAWSSRPHRAPTVRCARDPRLVRRLDPSDCHCRRSRKRLASSCRSHASTNSSVSECPVDMPNAVSMTSTEQHGNET